LKQKHSCDYVWFYSFLKNKPSN